MVRRTTPIPPCPPLSSVCAASLEHEVPEVAFDERIAPGARRAIERMLALDARAFSTIIRSRYLP